MKEEFKLVTREHGEEKGCDLSFLSEAEARKIRSFHQSFPMYAPTPLAHLPETAKYQPNVRLAISTGEKRVFANLLITIGVA